LLLVFAAVCVVLLIAAANVGSLMLARGTGRIRELAIRGALGAGRARLIRQLLVESLVLALLGGALGLLLAWGAMQVLEAHRPTSLPDHVALTLNVRVLLFSLGASVVCALLFGLVPALIGSRTQLHEAMRQGDARMSGGQHRLRVILVVAEVALAMDAAREQHAAHVRGGDEQHNADGREHEQQRGTNQVHAVRLHRSGARRLAAQLRVFRDHDIHERMELGRPTRDRGSRREAPKHVEEIVAAVGELVRREAGRDPEIAVYLSESVGDHKPCGQDSDHGGRDAIQAQISADERRVGAEVLAPRLFANDDDGVLTRRIVGRIDQPPAKRTDAEQRKEVSGDADRAHLNATVRHCHES